MSHFTAVKSVYSKVPWKFPRKIIYPIAKAFKLVIKCYVILFYFAGTVHNETLKLYKTRIDTLFTAMIHCYLFTHPEVDAVEIKSSPKEQRKFA